MVSPNRSNAGPRDPSVQAYRVPRGHVWLEGDNLANSTDSRRYGVVPESMIEGRCIFRVCIETRDRVQLSVRVSQR